MPAVFVNGIPETAAIWEPLLAELGRSDVIRLSPPGFGSPVPDGFDYTLQSYTQWLVKALESLGEPADLVGHDLGGAAVAGVTMTRPDLVATWVNDALGAFDPDYAWHGLAQVWQTPGDGEIAVAERMGGTPAKRAEGMAALGISRSVAARLGVAQGPEMGRAILGFYRSAVQPAMAEFGADLHRAAARPGLAVIPTEDHFVGSLEIRRRSALRAGARAAFLDGLGHWWMDQNPALSAKTLDAFWSAAR
jgi:pimeloyl-ACP methyl ester carboxylesterase